MVFGDSECVLHWIKSTTQLSVFIQNRINEIQDLIFAYVPSSQNPADYATRGLRFSIVVCGGTDLSGCSFRRRIGLPGICQALHLRDWNTTCLRLRQVMFEAINVVKEAVEEQKYLSPSTSMELSTRYYGNCFVLLLYVWSLWACVLNCYTRECCRIIQSWIKCLVFYCGYLILSIDDFLMCLLL